MYYLISKTHYHTARACKRSCRNWLTAVTKPKKTKVKKERKNSKKYSINHWWHFYSYPWFLDVFGIHFIFIFSLYQSYILHRYIIFHSHIIMRAYHTFIDYCTLSLGFFFTHWVYLYTHYPHWHVIVGFED